MRKNIPVRLTIIFIILASFVLGVQLPKLGQKDKKLTDNVEEVVPDEEDILTQKVIPDSGVNIGVSLDSTILKMIELGAIDKDKFESLYSKRGGMPEGFSDVLIKPDSSILTINSQNANIILNLLWPLGLSNKTQVMKDSPMGKEYFADIENFASTGGWTLGKVSGGKLFNNLPLIPLSKEQEDLVLEISQDIYRPCCGNSTYFPDCNHGAAMLGFLYLAVSQDMPKDEIYKNALILNSYWFPQTYVDLATYFEKLEGKSWEKVDPKLVLGQTYSSGNGYLAISKKLQDENLLPQVSGGGGCSV